MEKSDFPLTLKAGSPAHGGFSIGRYNNRVVLIKGAIPGESVEVAIEEDKKDYSIASVIKIIEPSPDRIEPGCKLFGLCGSCHLQHIAYKRQIRLKEQVLQDCLKRLGKIETELSQPLASQNPWKYRFRAQFKVGTGKIGFFKEKTEKIVHVERCPLMVDEINDYLRKTDEMLKNSADFTKDISEISISYGDAAAALIKISSKHTATDCNKLAAMFLNTGFGGICIEDSNKRLLRYKNQHITLELEGLKYTVSPMSFFQSNWRLNQALVKFIRDSLQKLNGKRVLDLYSGAGNFSLPAALDADEVIAVEENPYAVKDGRRNLKINGIKNCRFIHSSAETFQTNEKFNIFLLDPPRHGLTNKTINNILTMMPEQIVYVSCNPATLARDLKRLLGKYEIGSIRLIDFFPQTYHIESLVFLRLR